MYWKITNIYRYYLTKCHYYLPHAPNPYSQKLLLLIRTPPQHSLPSSQLCYAVFATALVFPFCFILQRVTICRAFYLQPFWKGSLYQRTVMRYHGKHIMEFPFFPRGPSTWLPASNQSVPIPNIGGHRCLEHHSICKRQVTRNLQNFSPVACYLYKKIIWSQQCSILVFKQEHHTFFPIQLSTSLKQIWISPSLS